ncbi:MAG: hypothetical protein EOM23_03655 [Candidatus Moranbacteria bacterium]|nr:hypothetical protein [Candidatus Moranbacteria bacterium]
MKLGKVFDQIHIDCIFRAGRSHLINCNYLNSIDTKTRNVALQSPNLTVNLRIGKAGIDKLLQI